MKKIGVVTINDNNNYGNRLQNYAVQQILSQYEEIDVHTVLNKVYLNKKQKNIFVYIKKSIRAYLGKIKRKLDISKKGRRECFNDFNLNIKFTKKNFNFFELKKFEDYDYFIAGSDQIWNPNFGRLTEFDLLEFTEKSKRVAFSASFGISELPEQYKEKARNALKDFKAISVREEAGKKIVEDLTGRKDIKVLVDPTMLLSAEEWDKVAKKPKQLKTDKYILNYFLGNLSDERRKEIDRVAKENGCEVINILDKKSPFYQTGPSEFLYLEKNAFLICTDSFHSCVFSILYNRPFIIFDREDSNVSMNSRIETLINKFNLKNRKFEAKINDRNLNHDYTEAYKILELERKKSEEFLKKALDIKE